MACLEDMSDDGVLEGVEMLARRSNEITAELLTYLIEVEERGLHLRACWSLFAFCGGGSRGVGLEVRAPERVVRAVGPAGVMAGGDSRYARRSASGTQSSRRWRRGATRSA